MSLFVCFVCCFDKLAPSPLNKRFKIRPKSMFESILVRKTVSGVLKRGIFVILRFVRQANRRAIAPASLWLRY